MEDITKGLNTGPIRVPKTDKQTQIETGMVAIANDFLQMNFNEMNPISYLKSVKRNIELLHKNPVEEEAESNDNNE